MRPFCCPKPNVSPWHCPPKPRLIRLSRPEINPFVRWTLILTPYIQANWKWLIARQKKMPECSTFGGMWSTRTSSSNESACISGLIDGCVIPQGNSEWRTDGLTMRARAFIRKKSLRNRNGRTEEKRAPDLVATMKIGNHARLGKAWLAKSNALVVTCWEGLTANVRNFYKFDRYSV